jgi:hypothetical protein
MKISSISFDNLPPITATDLTMGGLLEHIDGDRYMVLMIGARFVPYEDAFTIEPDQNCAVLGRHAVPGTPEEDEIYEEYYNLTLTPLSEEQQNGYPLLISDDDEEDPIGMSEEDKETLRNTPIEVIEHSGRTHLQNLLFSVHAHPMDGNEIIYLEVDLERVCHAMIGHLEQQKTFDESPENLAFSNGQIEVFIQMKAFFSHKI